MVVPGSVSPPTSFVPSARGAKIVLIQGPRSAWRTCFAPQCCIRERRLVTKQSLAECAQIGGGVVVEKFRTGNEFHRIAGQSRSRLAGRLVVKIGSIDVRRGLNGFDRERRLAGAHHFGE